jgi:Flp pilus assembly protein TadD
MLEWQYAIMKRNSIRFAVGLLLVTTSPSFVLAQEADDELLDDGTPVAKPVVEPAGSRELREAMRRIAVRPSDPEALFDAGNASLMLGDAGAALNFFTRAANLRPNDGRIKAGLGAATVRTENPFEALRLFDEAVKLGISERAIAVDRGLAFDLLGNFARAQQDYQLARTAAITDQLLVQQAVSLSLSGAKTEADNMLVPLLQKNNLDAWRARAFMLAARGELKESNRVTAGFLDSNSAKKMESYLRLMPQLTGAQQVAAIHFGHFPQSYQIGRDSPEVTRTAANTPQPTTGSGRLTPAGAPLGSATAAKPAITTPAKNVPAKLSKKDQEAADKVARKLESDKLAEAVRLAEAKKQAEAAQLLEAQKKQEAARFADAARVAESARVAEQQRILEQQKIAEAARIAEASRLAEQQRIAEVSRIADAARIAEEQKQAETLRIAKAQQQADADRIAEQKRQAEAIKLAEAQKVAAQPAVVVPAINTTDVAQTASATKIAEASVAKAEVAPIKDLPAPETARPLVDVALPTTGPASSDGQVPKADANGPLTGSNSPVTETPKVADVAVGTMPERPAIANAPTDGVDNQVSGVDVASTSNTGSNWVEGIDPNSPNLAVKTSPDNNAAPIEVNNQEAPVVNSEPTAKSSTSDFDLGAVVDAIEVPKSEQEQSVAAVDLNKLKVAAAKKAELEAAKAKAAELDKKQKGDDKTDDKSVKSKSKDKNVTDTPSRHWVQVATGSDTRGLGFDWRRLVKKNPELFKGREGWVAPWGKTNRLVVGPFADLKSAKKWETEFRKAGGNGFTWVSERGAEVERVRLK